MASPSTIVTAAFTPSAFKHTSTNQVGSLNDRFVTGTTRDCESAWL
jgi:hypothetical protein